MTPVLLFVHLTAASARAALGMRPSVAGSSLCARDHAASPLLKRPCSLAGISLCARDHAASPALLAGEVKAVQRGKAVRLKRDARVRLFVLYGVADSSISMRKWTTAAPDWLEVRVLELPGHGYLADEALPPCAKQTETPVDASELNRQRAQWVSALADDVMRVQAPGQGPGQAPGQAPGQGPGQAQAAPPCAFLGFSFGALLAYELVRELERRNAPPPLALIALGRGAPHAVTLSTARIAELQCYDAERVLTYQEALGFDSSKIAPSMRVRAASLFRAGCLLGAVHVGDESHDVDGAPNLWDDIEREVAHASGVPAVNCHVVSITGECDVCWPPRLVRRWRDVSSSRRGYKELELAGVAHEQLRNAPEAMEFVFDRLASVLAEQQAIAAQRWAEILAVLAVSSMSGEQ